jgi:uncharacterized protein
MTVPAITGVPTAVTALVGAAQQGPKETPVPVTSGAAFSEIFGPEVTPLSVAVSQFFDNGGEQALVVRVGTSAVAVDDDFSAPELERHARGLWALAAARFNLLCVPPYAFGHDADVSARTRGAAVALCRQKRAFFVADPLSAWTTAEAVLAGPDGLESTVWGLGREDQAAVYLPRLVVPSPAGGSPLPCGPCGAVAGVMARTDRRRGVWKAPAGPESVLQGATGLSRTIDDDEQEALNQAGVNALRAFPGRGLVVWGARTLASGDRAASEWKYIPVRRLSLFLEASIEDGTAWAAHEPNGAAMWAELRRLVSHFLDERYRAGAFAGRTAREAYFVKCDAQTTNAADIEAGQTHVVVGFAPLKPAEFVVLEVTVKTARPDDE